MTTQITKSNGSKQLSVRELFESRKTAIAEILPKHLSPDRLIKVALGAIAKTPKLQQCTAASVFNCLVTSAELGLEPGGALGHAYLVPYGTNAQLIIGYRGFVELGRRSGRLSQIEAHIIYEKEKYTIKRGLTPEFAHEPMFGGDRGKPIIVYCIARLADGGVHIEAMSVEDVEKIRARSRSKDHGPWVTDWEEMAKKTVVRRAFKYLPMSSEIAKAIEVDDEDFVEPEKDATVATFAEEIAASMAPTGGVQRAKEAVRRKLEIIDETAPEIPPPSDADAPAEVF